MICPICKTKELEEVRENEYYCDGCDEVIIRRKGKTKVGDKGRIVKIEENLSWIIKKVDELGGNQEDIIEHQSELDQFLFEKEKDEKQESGRTPREEGKDQSNTGGSAQDQT